MKELKFSSLTLRAKISLIVIATTILVGVSVYIATWFTVNDAENRYRDATYRGKEMLWEQVVQQQLRELELNTIHMQRNRELTDAVNHGDATAVKELSLPLYNRLSATRTLSDTNIFDKHGKIIFTSDEGESSFDHDEIVKSALKDSNVRSLLTLHEEERNGKKRAQLVAMTVFPLYARGAMAGIGVYEKDMIDILENFKSNDHSDVFIVSKDGMVEHSTNNEYNNYIKENIGAPGNTDKKDMTTIGIGDEYYRLARIPVFDHKNNIAAHLVTMNNITESYIHNRNTSLLSAAIIAFGIGAAVIWLFLYLRYSFSPLKDLTETATRLGKGETDVRAEVVTRDEIGKLAEAFNAMVKKIHDSLEHERQAAEDIEGKATLIHEVVEMASHGDLTGEMMVFRDQDVMSDLSESVTNMINNLNSLVTQVQKSGIQVTSSATQIAATAKQQEATITEQAATTNEIVATTKQISSTAKELLSTMSEITKVSEETATSAETGRSALAHMEDTMNHMVEASSSITSKLAVLNEKAGNINTVVTTITKVADQTNLLSLNAAIEAEKAGEYGVGFSVVATEIRRLADQTAVATWDIEQMVQEMQSAVSAGVMGMDKFSEEIRRGVDDVRKVGGQLSDIIEKVQAIIPRFEKVHEGMHSQTLGAEQISESMIQLNEAAQQTAESLRQSNDSIARLNEAAQGLQSGISKFKIRSA